MTEIDVPDWVVKAADEAGDEFDRTHTMSMYASVSDMRLDRVRHMLTAALGAWVETAGYVHPDTIKGLRAGLSSKSFLFAKPLPQMWADIPLYTLRQEKPE